MLRKDIDEPLLLQPQKRIAHGRLADAELFLDIAPDQERARNLLDIPAVFAGLLTVIVIGLIVENVVFQTIERHTILKWGMKE